MLSDPLIQEVMRSDRVSEREYEALLFRVKDSLDGRERPFRGARAVPPPPETDVTGMEMSPREMFALEMADA